MCPSDDKTLSLYLRGRRECRALAAPAASRAKDRKHDELVTTVTPSSPGIPRAMVLTGSFVLSPVIGLCCHRHLADISAKLDAGVEASGPHDFSVRDTRIRLVHGHVHRISCPTFCDDRETPLRRAGDARKNACDLPDVTSESACDTLARRANQVTRSKRCQGLIVIPGRASWREAGIHNHDREYMDSGFAGRNFAVEPVLFVGHSAPVVL
jgi:hypothetical protein